MDLPPLTRTHKLHQVLISTLRQQPLLAVEAASLPPWNAAFFGFDRVPLFQSSTAAQKNKILQIACQDMLNKVCLFEKVGVGYMATMTLLAETMEERMLYALFSADQAKHLVQLKPLLSHCDDILAVEAPFFKRLESLLESADRSVLLFIIQIVLEGWGLRYYRKLSRHCCNPMLADLFCSFYQSEAKHHRAGMVLFDSASLSDESRTTIIETLVVFLQGIQMGPHWLVEAIAAVKGDLSRSQTLSLLESLEAQRHSARRLDFVRSLITPVAPDIAETLDTRNLFSPLPVAQRV
ncbi:MAG: ferritin-like domain-containing protein [Cyanobacteria bacterium J06598_3]